MLTIHQGANLLSCLQAPSTAGSLAPSFNVPPVLEATNSSPLLPFRPSVPVWNTPNAFTDAHTAQFGGNSCTVGAQIPLPSPHQTVNQPQSAGETREYSLHTTGMTGIV